LNQAISTTGVVVTRHRTMVVHRHDGVYVNTSTIKLVYDNMRSFF